MKKGNSEKLIRTTYLLELGKDFQESDLEVIASNGINSLKAFNKNFRDTFYKHHLGSLYFSGHYDEETKTVLIKTEQEIFEEV